MARTWLEKARDFLSTRKQNYLRTFTCPTGEAVLQDLALFCRANKSTFVEDQRISDVLVGRREVWLRIQQHLNLSDEGLWELCHGGNKEKPQQ